MYSYQKHREREEREELVRAKIEMAAWDELSMMQDGLYTPSELWYEDENGWGWRDMRDYELQNLYYTIDKVIGPREFPLAAA